MQESPHFVLCKTVCTGPTKVSSKVGLLEGFVVGRALVAPLWQTNLKAPNRVSRESGVSSLAGFKLVPGVYEGLSFVNGVWRTSCILD